MKKQVKKLTLAKETLTRLEKRGLQAVAGGYTSYEAIPSGCIYDHPQLCPLSADGHC